MSRDLRCGWLADTVSSTHLANISSLAGDLGIQFEPLAKLDATAVARCDAIAVRGANSADWPELLAAAEAGRHLWIDATVLADADRVREVNAACRDGRGVLMIGQPLRFHPGISALNAPAEAGSLGKPGLVRSHRWQTPETVGRFAGPIPPSLVLDIDIACWLMDDFPSTVYAVGQPAAADGATPLEFMQLHLGFPSGAMALIDWYGQLPEGENYYALTWIGARGAAYADDHRNVHLQYSGGRPQATIPPCDAAAQRDELRAFAAAIEGQSPQPPPEQLAVAFEVLAAAAQSLASGQPQPGDRRR